MSDHLRELTLAIDHGAPDAILDLLSRHELNQLLRSNNKALHHFLGCLSPQNVVKFLQEHAGHVDTRDLLGSTSLHYAVRANKPTLVELLVLHGADVNATNFLGDTPLHIATNRSTTNSAMTELLLKHGADVNARDGDNWTPLHSAIYQRDQRTLKLFLDRGGDIELRNSDGRTALSMAVYRQDSELVEMLIERGADVHAKDRWEVSPVSCAARIMGFPTVIVETLLNHGADVFELDEKVRGEVHRVGDRVKLVLAKQLIRVRTLMGLRPGTFLETKEGERVVKRQGLEEFERVCRRQVERMNSEEVCPGRNVSFKDIVTRRVLSVAMFLGVREARERLEQKDAEEICGEFKFMFRDKVKKAMWLYRKYEALRFLLGEGMALPWMCLNEILNYLEEREIYGLLRAFS